MIGRTQTLNWLNARIDELEAELAAWHAAYRSKPLTAAALDSERTKAFTSIGEAAGIERDEEGMPNLASAGGLRRL